MGTSGCLTSSASKPESWVRRSRWRKKATEQLQLSSSVATLPSIAGLRLQDVRCLQWQHVSALYESRLTSARLNLPRSNRIGFDVRVKNVHGTASFGACTSLMTRVVTRNSNLARVDR